jgi:hypothetical protein
VPHATKRRNRSKQPIHSAVSQIWIDRRAIVVRRARLAFATHYAPTRPLILDDAELASV